MTAVKAETGGEREAHHALSRIGGLLLARITCEGGVTRAEMVRDLLTLVSHRLSPGEWRQRVESETAALLEGGLVAESRSRFTATAAGLAAAADLLGEGGLATRTWPDRRDIALVALALTLTELSPQRLKALAKPEGLRNFILQRAYGLPLKGNSSASRLRAQLAGVALKRAFGTGVRSGLGQGSGLSATAARELAGQLSRTRKDFGTDARLIIALAAEQAQSVQSDADSLRQAILRSYFGQGLEARPQDSRPLATAPAIPARPLAAANDTTPRLAAPSAPELPLETARPDLVAFAREVQHAARARAEGWPGNRKAFISLVWQSIRSTRPSWGLSEIEFKGLLAEAHRAGHIVLASADLKDKKCLKEVQDSAITYKNTVWHFVRVEDELA